MTSDAILLSVLIVTSIAAVAFMYLYLRSIKHLQGLALDKQNIENNFQAQLQSIEHEAELSRQSSLLQISQLQTELKKLATYEEENQELAMRYQQLMTDFKVQQASAQEERKSQQEKLQLLEQSKHSLKVEFENLANQLLEKKSESLKERQEDFFAQSLTPLREQLKEFRQRVDKVYESESRDRLNLLNELQQLKSLNQKISDDAINLTNALKGSQKFQGNWGELVLERVLETSGLRNGYEYELQASRKSTDGKTYLPDVIVNLPDDKQLIIDSKVSLLDYQRYIEEEDKALKAEYLTSHINSVKAHIKGLSDKKYDDLVGVNSLDFVFLFVPIEAAFLLALEKQPELFQQAYDKHVILVSPTTLLATLRTVENMWRYERQNQNAEKIASQAGALYDQCVLVAESIEDVGKAINKSFEAYELTKKRLMDGRGNVLRRIENIKKLGAKTKKQLPVSFSAEIEMNDDHDREHLGAAALDD